MSLYDASKEASLAVDVIEQAPHPRHHYNIRTKYSILASATSEFGELAQEVMINQNHSYKEEGPDGIIGEAIDTIACLLDLIHKTDPLITENELEQIARTKCAKWISKVKESRGV